MDSHAMLRLKAYIFGANKTWQVQHEVSDSDVIQFVFGTTTTSSQGNEINVKSEQFSEFGS